MKKPLIILTGPTAVGKTKASIGLAKALNGEIISADSMQVYKHMDIGSAKITAQEMQGVPHHLIDILEPWDEFNVVVFKQKCEEVLDGIYERGAYGDSLRRDTLKATARKTHNRVQKRKLPLSERSTSS